MKRLFLIVFFVITITACTSSQETLPSAFTTIPLTVTQAPTQTPEPSLTPTPTPEPYLLEEGTLLDWDDKLGNYQVVAEGIDALTTTVDGAMIALDGSGSPKIVYVEGVWVDVIIPEGAENHEELVIPDRHVSVVNEEGKVEEVLESGIKVLVNPDTGVYEYELKNGQWVDYEFRVRIVGEKVADEDHPRFDEAFTEVPKEVVETAVETVRNATMFTRNGMELKTGYDEVLGEYENFEDTLIPWHGVLCGAVDSNVTFSSDYMVAGFMGVELNSGDVMLVTVMFGRNDIEAAYFGREFVDGIVPSSLDGLKRVNNDFDEHVMNKAELAETILNTSIGTPFYLATSTKSTRDELKQELLSGVKALKTGELENNGGLSGWTWEELGATDEFWNDAIK